MTNQEKQEIKKKQEAVKKWNIAQGKAYDKAQKEAVPDTSKGKTEPVRVPKDAQEVFLFRALWECVKSGTASSSLIQRRLSCSYAIAAHALEWMEENGFIGSHPNREVKMSVDDYYAKFGHPDKVQEQSEDEERERYIDERRRALMERLIRMSDDDDDV